MPSKTPLQVTDNPLKPEGTSVPEVEKTDTNWEVFAKCGLVPVHISCELYTPTYRRTGGCHTALLINSATLRRHANPDHGGGFRIFLRKTDGKASPLWADLSTSGLEATDMLCDTCGKVIRMTPMGVMEHARPHAGETRQSYPEMRRRFPTAVIGLRVSLGEKRTEELDSVEDEYNQ